MNDSRDLLKEIEGAADLGAVEALRVRLLAVREDRIAVLQREKGLSPQEAERYLEETDQQRRRFIREHFGKDPADPQNYDLVLNTSRLSVAKCADLIIAALHHLQGRSDLHAMEPALSQ